MSKGDIVLIIHDTDDSLTQLTFKGDELFHLRLARHCIDLLALLCNPKNIVLLKRKKRSK